MNTKYNGWANRETWLVNLHFNLETKSDVDYAKETIQEWYDNLDGFMRDFVDIDCIDWDELYAHMDNEEESENED
jgi:hypothetical protein